MKNSLKMVLILFILTLYGCNEQLNQPQDITMFEKRTPITNRDSVKNRVPLQRALECLNLTRDQKIVIDSIIGEERLCSLECKKEFHDSIKTLREVYKSELEKYSNMEKNDQINREIEILKFQFRQTQRDLQKEYRKKMDECVKNTFVFIESILRKDQLTLWNLWKATGKIPCDRVGKP